MSGRSRATIAAAATSTRNPFSGLSRPAAPTTRAGGRGKRARSSLPVSGIGRLELVRVDRVADDHDTILRDPGAAHLDGLALRDADRAVHPAQPEPIQDLVEPDLARGRGPAVDHADDRDASPPRRRQAHQVRLVTTAAEDPHLQATEMLRDLPDHRADVRDVPASSIPVKPCRRI